MINSPRRNLFLWGHNRAISFLLFSIFGYLRFFNISIFSVRHSWQNLSPGLYDLHLHRMFHFMSVPGFSSFSQMNLDNWLLLGAVGSYATAANPTWRTP